MKFDEIYEFLFALANWRIGNEVTFYSFVLTAA